MSPQESHGPSALLGDASARAHSNIALVKYWGKRAGFEGGNLPAVGSISITLDALSTWTRVRFVDRVDQDTLTMSGEPAPEKDRARISRFLDLVRSMGTESRFAQVDSRNNFPTGAGLASSASGFAALALAATAAAGLELAPGDLSVLARKGSGSAARSVFGGFVELKKGVEPSGDDCRAHPLASSSDWPLSVVVGVTSEARKETGSTEGMELCSRTSPYYPAWVDSHPADLDQAREAIANRDFDQLATVTEFSCLKMHASMMASQPGLVYMQPATLACLHEIRKLRREGTAVCFTADAGPQVKAICEPSAIEPVQECLKAMGGVKSVFVSSLGGPSILVDPETLSGAS